MLDPTTHVRQAGVYRIGPVSVAEVREDGIETCIHKPTSGGTKENATKGKIVKYKARGENGVEYVSSQINADLRFLRVSKSFSNITNRILSVALVAQNQTGVQLVTANNSILSPLNVTDTYKSAQLREEALPLHVDPPPSRDCTVNIATSDDSKLGDKISLNITVTNNGPFLRTLDGKVEGHIVRSVCNS